MLDIPAPKTYGHLALERETKRWILSNAPPHVALRLKGMFPRISKTDSGIFAFRHDPSTCVDLSWFMHRFPMAMSVEDRRLLSGAVALDAMTRQAADRLFVPGWSPSPTPSAFKPGMAPYEMQVQAADLAVMFGRLLVMDDVGLGKTVSALTAVLKAGFGPAAIVVQSHLQTQWLVEYVEKFTTLTGHMIKTKAPYDLPKADVYLFKYSQLAGWTDIFATGAFPIAVWDEIQELRAGLETQKGQAAKVQADHARLRIGLSATPIFNLGAEMYDIMEYIEPGCLGMREEFFREWCSTGRVVKDPDALGAYLREQHLVIRRERAGGRVNTILIEVPFDEEATEDHQALAKRLAIQTLQGNFLERGKAARELDMLLRQITGIAKARHVAAYVRMLLKAGKPVLLAGWHRAVYEMWNRELAEFNPVMYTGSESQKQKDEAKAAFIEGRTDLMMISLRSGAGLDGLQLRCATAVIGELDWSPKVHEQLIGRLDRPKQTADVVDAIFLHTDGGSDPLIIELLGLKASQSHGIVNPGQTPQPVRSDESRLKLLAERYLAQIIVNEDERAAA